MAYKILIIDDHPETRSIIGQVLKQKGYHIVTAENGQQGLEVAESERPHIILCDYMMPLMDGVETVRHLRKNPNHNKVPIIMFTAVDDPQQKLAAFDAGADDYLNKPTEPPELIDRVQILLESAYGDVPEITETSEDVSPQDAPKLLSQLDIEPEPEEAFPLTSSQQVIAVMGVRGGAGTTTMAINLATVLSGFGTTTTLADFDVKSGHIGLYLNQKKTGALNTLATLPDTDISAQVSTYLETYTPNLKLLLSHLNIDARYPSISGSQAVTLLMALAEYSKATVIDLGSTVNGLSRSTLELADDVVLCLRPERIALVAARQLLAQLQKILFPHTKIHVALMDFSSGGTQLPKTAVEGFLGYTVEGILPISPREMAKAANKAKPLVTLYTESEASIAFQQFVHLLKKE